MSGILVVAETLDGAVTAFSHELLGAARQLSSQGGGNVTAIVSGDDAAGKDLIAHGADAAFTATAGTGTADEWLPALEAAISQSGADIVLIGQTSLGREIGPALAFKLGTAVAMDCVELKIDGGRLRATRNA